YLSELWSNNTTNDSDTIARMHVEAHRRLADPIYCIAMALVAAACLLGTGQPRQNQNLKILTATGCAGAVMISAFALRGYTDSGTSAAPFIYALPLSAVALSFWPLLRARVPGRAQR